MKYRSNVKVKCVILKFDLDPMALTLVLDLDMVKLYLCIKNEIPSYSSLKVTA